MLSGDEDRMVIASVSAGEAGDGNVNFVEGVDVADGDGHDKSCADAEPVVGVIYNGSARTSISHGSLAPLGGGVSSGIVRMSSSRSVFNSKGIH